MKAVFSMDIKGTTSTSCWQEMSSSSGGVTEIRRDCGSAILRASFVMWVYIMYTMVCPHFSSLFHQLARPGCPNVITRLSVAAHLASVSFSPLGSCPHCLVLDDEPKHTPHGNDTY